MDVLPVRSGDQAALSPFVAMSAQHADFEINASERAALVAFLMRKSGSAILAEDIAQDAFIRLVEFQRREKVRNARGLLFKIAVNLLINHQRRERRMVAGLVEDYADERPSQERAALDNDRMRQFRKALETLPPLRREVLIRRRLENQSYQEIGKALNLSSAAVEKHVVRALASLRAYQDKFMIEGERPW
ncbi:RNA polymerase sigma factor [Novosphingobium pentaromativorans]|uniref:ECF subfamily RNA polymerase sigma-70 factor n=1 Tax=Novosphingobium pentaromativorans US6-1 TaxID=1088721 RepID=G6EFY2_9SPHN|nr:RNA polymerase sigma factor [Novosphingobium pentaromativorans]AIT82319.1 RNA polymerase subunit sigma-70 [Novosphingobium pentaromativorans US6-1]EHJ59671.1 ECF subfamily RNA polymerase sigma-70 factor [Novosphingobium pentaromativorans US6-1]